MNSEQYIRCGGCGRFVAFTNLDKHYSTNHQEGIAVESPAPPATVANPPQMPYIGRYPIPPSTPEPKSESFVINIMLMYKSYPRAFRWWTLIVFLLSMLFTSNLFVWIVFHI